MLVAAALFGEEEHLYVVDRDAHQVVIYDLEGHRKGSLGLCHQPGKSFRHPTNVAVFPDGRIAVADGYGNAYLHVFSSQGELLRTFGKLGIAPGALLSPHAVWPIRHGQVGGADRENHRLQLFDLDGNLLDVRTGFFRPQEIWGNGDGQLLLLDSIPSLSLLTEQAGALAAAVWC